MEVLNIDLDFFNDCQKEGGLTIAFDGSTKMPAEILTISTFENYHGINRIPFSVVFIIKETEVFWPQNIYNIYTKENKYAAVFLVPIGPSENGMRYEAVFS